MTYVILKVPGEAEAGSAGEQPAKEYPGTAHRDDVLGAGNQIFLVPSSTSD